MLATKKKGLFEEEEEVVAKPSKQAPAPKKKTLFDNDEADDFSMKKPAGKKPSKANNLFGDEGEDDFPVVKAKPSAKNKKKLFDDSDWVQSDDSNIIWKGY